jgi:hypothetical protein
MESSKIKAIFTEISTLCGALKQAVQQCEQNVISISFVTTLPDDVSSKSFDRTDPLFMYTQILKEILLTINLKETHIKEFTNCCREQFAYNYF